MNTFIISSTGRGSDCIEAEEGQDSLEVEAAIDLLREETVDAGQGDAENVLPYTVLQHSTEHRILTETVQFTPNPTVAVQLSGVRAYHTDWPHSTALTDTGN